MRFKTLFLSLAAACGLQAAIIGTATYTVDQLGPTSYQYDLTLTNTGSTTIGTFWFGWVPGAGFLSAAPTNIIDPTGWTDVVTNANSAIQWKTTTNLLAPGNSITGFEFTSSETPTQLLGTVPGGTGAGDPITTSFIYIAAPLADPGFQLVATQTTPEPATFGLVVGALGVLALARKRIV